MTLTLEAFPAPLSHALEGWGTEGGCSSFRVRGTCELPWGTALRVTGRCTLTAAHFARWEAVLGAQG